MMIKSSSKAHGTVQLAAPVSGRCIPLHAAYIPQSFFAQLGHGFVIVPTDGTVTAPFDATITRTSEDRRSVVLVDRKTGCVAVISADYIGSSDAFHLNVRPDQQVSKGDTLFTLDTSKLRMGTRSILIPCVVTNMLPAETHYGDMVGSETTVLTAVAS
ncbi:MAG: PTS glucose transporter subunit IIA [Butyricicoccus sp.]